MFDGFTDSGVVVLSWAVVLSDSAAVAFAQVFAVGEVPIAAAVPDVPGPVPVPVPRMLQPCSRSVPDSKMADMLCLILSSPNVNLNY